MTLFTDWDIYGDRSIMVYPYIRGAIWGFVVASFFWLWFVPWVKSKLSIDR